MNLYVLSVHTCTYYVHSVHCIKLGSGSKVDYLAVCTTVRILHWSEGMIKSSYSTSKMYIYIYKIHLQYIHVHVHVHV